MGNVSRKIRVNDNLSGKTLNFDFSSLITRRTDSSFFEGDLIYVNSNNKIYTAIRSVIVSGVEVKRLLLKVLDNGTEHTIRTINLGTTTPDSATYTLSNSFGTVQSINLEYGTEKKNILANEIYNSIFLQTTGNINFNNTNVNNIYFNNTKINKVYLNNEQIY